MTTIDTEESFLRTLREHPEWREAVRTQILGEELLQLPSQFQQFVRRQTEFNEIVANSLETLNRTVAQLVAGQARLEARQQRLEDSQQRLEGSQQRLESRMERIENDIGIIRGQHARGVGADEAYGLADDLGLDFTRRLTYGELSKIGRAYGLSKGDLESFRRADLIFTATNQQGEEIYLTVEISFTADRRDTDRAFRNAEILRQQTGRQVIPAIMGVRNDHETEEVTTSGQIYWHELEERQLRPE